MANEPRATSEIKANSTLSRVLCHNKEIRNKMETRANSIYYNLRRQPQQSLDIVRELSDRFKKDERYRFHLSDFKRRCGSKDMSPLTKYFDQKENKHAANKAV